MVAGSIPVTPALWEYRLMEGHRSSKSICVGSSPTIPAKYGTIAQLEERSPCKREVRGSRPLGSTVTEPKVVAGLICEISNSGLNSRRSPQMEVTANG